MSQNNNKKHATRQKQQKSWPLLLLLGGGLLLVLGAVFAFNQLSSPNAPVEVKGAPSLKVDRNEIDLGDVKLGQYVEASFLLTNVGDQPLRFMKTPYIEIKEGC